jgi:hypothetical protein
MKELGFSRHLDQESVDVFHLGNDSTHSRSGGSTIPSVQRGRRLARPLPSRVNAALDVVPSRNTGRLIDSALHLVQRGVDLPDPSLGATLPASNGAHRCVGRSRRRSRRIGSPASSFACEPPALIPDVFPLGIHGFLHPLEQLQLDAGGWVVHDRKLQDVRIEHLLDELPGHHVWSRRVLVHCRAPWLAWANERTRRPQLPAIENPL